MVLTDSCWAEVLPAPRCETRADTGQNPWESPGPLHTETFLRLGQPYTPARELSPLVGECDRCHCQRQDLSPVPFLLTGKPSG